MASGLMPLWLFVGLSFNLDHPVYKKKFVLYLLTATLRCAEYQLFYMVYTKGKDLYMRYESLGIFCYFFVHFYKYRLAGSAYPIMKLINLNDFLN